MTRVSRAVWTLLTTFAVSALVTLPAAAAEETTQATGFPNGEWDGMIVTAIAALLVGSLVFAMCDPGGIPRVDDH